MCHFSHYFNLLISLLFIFKSDECPKKPWVTIAHFESNTLIFKTKIQTGS